MNALVVPETITEFEKLFPRTHPSCSLAFVFGTSSQQSHDDSLISDNIEAEAAMYEDILQEDFGDSYNNLTLKTLFSIK